MSKKGHAAKKLIVVNHNSNDSNIDDIDTDDKVCICCLNSVSADDQHLRCEICCQVIRMDCTPIPQEARAILTNYASAIGHVCDDCCQTMKATQQHFEMALGALSIEITQLHTEVEALKSKDNAPSTNLTPHKQNIHNLQMVITGLLMKLHHANRCYSSCAASTEGP